MKSKSVKKGASSIVIMNLIILKYFSVLNKQLKDL